MVKDFLVKHCESMPEGAKNPLCWFTEATWIYEGYSKYCRELGQVQAGKKEFTETLFSLFPMAKLCDIRGVKQFVNVRFNPPFKSYGRGRAAQNRSAPIPD